MSSSRMRRSPVSVVIPVLDDGRYLRRCLTALARQRRRPLEIVVVDNGSRDHSRRVARRAGARVVRERRRGIPAAASRGYDAARGAVIARLDADSVPAEDWVERIEAAFARDPALAALTGPGEFGVRPPRRWRAAALLYLGTYFTVVGGLLGRPPVFGSNLAMRRSAWRAARGDVHRRDRFLHDDLDLSIHLPGRVRVDRDLRVVISRRPLRSARALSKRAAMGVWTVVRHLPAIVRGRAARAEGRIG